MKIFAKKKRTSTGVEKSESPGNKKVSKDAEADTTPVASYFDNADGAGEADEKSSSKDKKKEVVMDIEELLKMEFGSLNAKQRRLVKRHQQTHGEAPAASVVETKKAAEEKATSDGAEAESSDSSDDDSSDVEESAAGNDMEIETSEEVKPVKNNSANETKKATGEVPPEIQAIANKDASDRNSKQRRQLKRYTDTHGEVAAIELTADGQPVKKKRRRNGKSDVSSLTEEETQRRKEQATSAKDMQEKRNLGLVVSDGRHPLNSQRRRANRRKPGKAGMLAAAKRDRKAKFQ
jgi:hypothetical protein